VSVDRSSRHGDVGPPHAVQQPVAGHDPTGLPHQLRQEFEFLGSQVDLGIANEATMPSGIKLQRTVDEQARFVRTRIPTPQHRAHPQYQLARAEGLRDIVIGTEFEADHAVDFVGTRGEHDDRKLREGRIGTELATQIGARQVGQHQVEHHQVRACGLQRLHRFTARGRRVDLEARLAEVEANQLEEIGLVVDDENSFRHVSNHINRALGGKCGCRAASESTPIRRTIVTAEAESWRPTPRTFHRPETCSPRSGERKSGSERPIFEKNTEKMADL
jgi:hypothetical protein